MVSGAGDPVFVDTNVLVYASLLRSPFHQSALSAIQALHDSGVEIWISRQVLREYIATLTRPQTYEIPQPVEVVISDIRHFQNRFMVAEDSSEVTERLLRLMEIIPIGGSQVHDANIVATMQTNGISRLLTANVRDFDRFSQLVTLIPLDTA